MFTSAHRSSLQSGLTHSLLHVGDSRLAMLTEIFLNPQKNLQDQLILNPRHFTTGKVDQLPLPPRPLSASFLSFLFCSSSTLAVMLSRKLFRLSTWTFLLTGVAICSHATQRIVCNIIPLLTSYEWHSSRTFNSQR